MEQANVVCVRSPMLYPWNSVIEYCLHALWSTASTWQEMWLKKKL